MVRIVFALALAAADWLSSSADPQHTRSQPAETELSPATVRNLKLLWKYPFDEQVTAPVVLGPIFTHRGVKELVFVAGADNNLYAVDADLARLVWKRHFDFAAGLSDCPKTPALTAAPVLAPYNGPVPEGDDPSSPRRSLFLLTSDGLLHTVRPSDAKDLALPERLLPAGSVAGDLTLTSNRISTYVSSACTFVQSGMWSHDLKSDGSAVEMQSAPPTSVATWNGVRVSATANQLLARRDANLLWSVDNLDHPQPPVVANGLAFTVTGTALAAFDIIAGKQLFLSAANGPGPAHDSLAIANGHVYFIAGNTLYCFGFPIEI